MPWFPLPRRHPLQWRHEWLVQRAVLQQCKHGQWLHVVRVLAGSQRCCNGSPTKQPCWVEVCSEDRCAIAPFADMSSNAEALTLSANPRSPVSNKGRRAASQQSELSPIRGNWLGRIFNKVFAAVLGKLSPSPTLLFSSSHVRFYNN